MEGDVRYIYRYGAVFDRATCAFLPVVHAGMVTVSKGADGWMVYGPRGSSAGPFDTSDDAAAAWQSVSAGWVDSFNRASRQADLWAQLRNERGLRYTGRKRASKAAIQEAQAQVEAVL